MCHCCAELRVVRLACLLLNAVLLETVVCCLGYLIRPSQVFRCPVEIWRQFESRLQIMDCAHTAAILERNRLFLNSFTGVTNDANYKALFHSGQIEWDLGTLVDH